MTSCDENAKRWRIWRPRFTVRTLAIFVTLVCAYFGAWEATKTFGVPKHFLTIEEHFEQNGVGVSTRIMTATSPLPFVICQDEGEVHAAEFHFSNVIVNRQLSELHSGQHYYLWLLGPKVKLPQFKPTFSPSEGGFF